MGSKRTVQLAIAGVIIATLGIVGVTADRVLFVIPADPLEPTRGLFGSTQEKVFMAFALLLGFCMGPMQAASRTLIGRLAPEGMTGEFYGLFALSGRATAWMAPTAIGIITVATQSNRLGIACVLFFLVLGFCLLWTVREERAHSSRLSLVESLRLSFVTERRTDFPVDCTLDEPGGTNASRATVVDRCGLDRRSRFGGRDDAGRGA